MSFLVDVATARIGVVKWVTKTGLFLFFWKVFSVTIKCRAVCAALCGQHICPIDYASMNHGSSGYKTNELRFSNVVGHNVVVPDISNRGTAGHPRIRVGWRLRRQAGARVWIGIAGAAPVVP